MRWLDQDWHRLLPAPWAGMALVVAAVLCGGIVGVDRERKQKAVGFRTLVLVSIGSAVFTMAGAATDHRSPIAAQVVSGIGFLGAGVILRGPFGVTGLTSAATIWTMAAIGMTVGMGYAGAGVALSIFLLGTVTLVSLWEQRYIGPCRFQRAALIFRALGGKSAIRIEEVLDEYRFAAVDYEFCELPPGSAQGGAEGLGLLRLRYCAAHRRHREFLAYLAALPEVSEIRREPDPALPGETPA